MHAPHVARQVFDVRKGKFETFVVHERSELPCGVLVRGPALVVEDETTTVVPGRFSVRADPSGHLILERQHGEEVSA